MLEAVRGQFGPGRSPILSLVNVGPDFAQCLEDDVDGYLVRWRKVAVLEEGAGRLGGKDDAFVFVNKRCPERPEFVGGKIANSRKAGPPVLVQLDRKSTRLNSSHVVISYAVFCLKKKKNYK